MLELLLGLWSGGNVAARLLAATGDAEVRRTGPPGRARRRSRVLGVPHTRLASLAARRVVRAELELRRLDHHAGIDVAYVAQGELVLEVAGVAYPLREGECVVWPSSHPHTMRNESDGAAIPVGFATEIVH